MRREYETTLSHKGDKFPADRYCEQMKAAAALVIPQVRAEQAGEIAEFLRGHAEDCAAYEFKCERFGDFLSVFIRRGKKTKYRVDHIVVAINIGASPAIKFVEGRGADLLGTTTLKAEWCGHSDKHLIGKIIAEPSERLWGDGYQQMFVLPRKPDNAGYYSSYESTIETVDATARPPQDDLIVVEPDVGTIHVPFGRGQAIYNQILNALRGK